MDVWVALAVAGAGYVAKHWKNAIKGIRNSSDLTPQSHTLTGHHIDNTSCPFRRLVPCLVLQEKSENNNKGSTEDVGFMSSGYLENEVIAEEEEELGLTDVTAPNKSWKTETRLRYDFNRQYDLQMMKPLTSLDSCLLAQLYNEHDMTCFVSPFIVTDGRKIINWCDLHLKNRQMSLVENVIVYGVPSLSYNLSLEVPRRGNAKRKGLHGEFSSSVVQEKHLTSLAGSTNGALLFGLGVAVGLIYSLLGNKRDVDRLNGLLKQTESLVQDLQDELEMKTSLTVKELHTEFFESQGTNLKSCDETASCSFSVEQNSDGSFMNNGISVFDQRRDGDLESMSKIEAELEAELRRLELNFNLSSLERRLSDLVESDPNFAPGISQSELRADMFGAQAHAQPYADQDGSGTCTPHPPDYSVSHRELTLRLHEVIQTRLEARVKELETALEISEKKVQDMESEHKMINRDYSDCDSISSPITIEERNLMDQPVIINLTGEALDAYNEVSDELKKVNEYKEYNSKGNDAKKDPDLDVYQDRNGELKPYSEHYVGTNDNALPRAESTLDWPISSGDIDCSGTDSESDDEFEKLLIKQIVEKNRRNSSVIVKVERELFHDKHEQ